MGPTPSPPSKGKSLAGKKAGLKLAVCHKVKTSKVEQEETSRLLALFRKFDTDGSGTLSRDELEMMLAKLGTLDGTEIGRLMDAIDTNDDGKISYEEFVAWLTGSGRGLDLEGPPKCDIQAILTPLFRVYDRDGNGSISRDEFREVYTILQKALNSSPHSEEQEFQGKTVAKLMCDYEEDVWAAADLNSDDRIEYEEFLDWLRDCIEHSGQSPEELVVRVQQLATLLDGVFVICKTATRRKAEDPALEALLVKAGECAQQLFEVHRRVAHDCPTEGACDPALWTLPHPLPEGMALDKLVHKHIEDNVPTADVVSLVVRMQALVATTEGRWLARVARISTHISWQGRIRPGDPVRTDFFYAFDGRSWQDLGTSEEFFQVVHQLPPELRLYSMFLATSDLETGALGWDSAQHVFAEAVELGFLSREDLMAHRQRLESALVVAALEASPSTLRDHDEARAQVRRGMATLDFSPKQVMQQLRAMGLVGAHPLWAGTTPVCGPQRRRPSSSCGGAGAG